jgi:hypothetical protein
MATPIQISEPNFAARPFNGPTADAAIEAISRMLPTFTGEATKLRLMCDGVADFYSRAGQHSEHARYSRLAHAFGDLLQTMKH